MWTDQDEQGGFAQSTDVLGNGASVENGNPVEQGLKQSFHGVAIGVARGDSRRIRNIRHHMVNLKERHSSYSASQFSSIVSLSGTSLSSLLIS